MNRGLPPSLRDLLRLVPVLLLDAAVVLAAYAAALALRFDGDVPSESIRFFAAASPFIALAYLVGNFFFRIYRTSWKYAGIVDALNIALSIGVVSIFLFAINAFLSPRHIPLTVNVVAPALMLIAMGGIKFWPRLWASRNPFGGYDAGVKNVLIVGAGHTGQLLAREFLQNPRWQYRPIGFVDDDRRLRGVRIHAVTVLGDRHDIPDICARKRVDLVALAIPSAGGAVIREVVGIVQSTRVPLRTVPGLRDLVHNESEAAQLREVTVDDLLGRDQVEIDAEMCAATIRGRSVMITGAAGFIAVGAGAPGVRVRPGRAAPGRRQRDGAVRPAARPGGRRDGLDASASGCATSPTARRSMRCSGRRGRTSSSTRRRTSTSP